MFAHTPTNNERKKTLYQLIERIFGWPTEQFNIFIKYFEANFTSSIIQWSSFFYFRYALFFYVQISGQICQVYLDR